MSFSIRIANPADAELITQLADRIWRKHYMAIIGVEQVNYMLDKMYSVESLIHQMTTEGHRFYIGSKDDTPIAYASVSDNEGDMFLHKLYIDTELQTKGFGTKMVENMLQLYPHKKTLQLTVNRKNYKAINFYFKLGFKIDHVADFDIGEGFFMNDFVMIKQF